MTTGTPSTVALPRILWRRPRMASAPRALVIAAIGAGVVTAAVAVAPLPGVGAAIGIVATTAAVWPFTRGRRDAELLGWGVCAIALALVVVVRDAPWLVTVDLLAALGVASVALARPRTLAAHVVAGIALGLASVKGARWMATGVAGLLSGRTARLRPWVRAVAVSAPLLIVFGLLFSSADKVFGRVLSSLTPDVSLDELPARIAVFAIAALCVLAAGYLLAATPRFDAIIGETRRQPARIEWVLPLASLVTMVTLFVTVQIGAWLGGDAYVQRTAGLTYAQYARTGFAQLVAAAVLTLAVIAGAVRWAPRARRTDRLVRNSLLGSLCLCTLVVLASAAHRLALYDANYGLTQLRFCVMAAIGWIGAVFMLVLAAGGTRTHSWLPHAILASMVMTLLGVTLANPDARVADSLVTRYLHTGRIDTAYLSQLSADAVPALRRLPVDQRLCAMSAIGNRWHRADGTGGWPSANVSRSRADAILLGAGVDTNVPGLLQHSSSAACFASGMSAP